MLCQRFTCLKTAFATVLASLALAWAGTPARAEKPIDFVIDLDWTLFYEIFDERQLSGRPARVLEHEGHRYVMTDDAPRFVQKLLSVPGARVSFFSGGDEARNRFLLEQLRLPDGRTAAEAAFRVLSRDDLTPIEGVPDGASFSKRFKKDLSKLASDAELARTILIDDQPGFALKGQEKNLLSLEPTFDFAGNYNAVKQEMGRGLSLRFPAPSRETWALEREKLARAAGLIDAALEKSAREGVSPRDALHSLQYDPQGLKIYPFGHEQRTFYARGRELLKSAGACESGFSLLGATPAAH